MFKQYSKRQSLSEKISEDILGLILEKKLKPGDQLPPERELAKTLSVSRNSLREALRVLSIMKVLDIKQGNGTFITSLEPNLLVQNMNVFFALNKTTFSDLMDFNRIFQPAAAMLAAKNATDDDIGELEKIFKTAINHKYNISKFIETAQKIHEKIFEMTNNSLIFQISKLISQLTMVSGFKTAEVIGVSEKALIEISKTIDAIKNHDTQKAFESMRKHVEELEYEIKEKYPSMGFR